MWEMKRYSESSLVLWLLLSCGQLVTCCKEIQDVSKLIEGKDINDTFAQALVKGVCAKLKSISDLSPGDALKIKDAARFLADAHHKSIVDELEKALVSGGCGQQFVLKPQTLLHIYNYMTSNDWKELDNPSTSWARKHTVVAFRLKSLGIASRHEQTMKSCMALLACSLTVVPDEKMMYPLLQEFQATFAGTLCTTKCTTILKYLENPEELSQAVCQAAYGSDQPCPRVIDKFNLVARKVVLRSTAKQLRNTNAQVEQPQSAPAGSSSSMMNEMMQAPMMQMLSMLTKFMGMSNHGDRMGQHQQHQGQDYETAAFNALKSKEASAKAKAKAKGKAKCKAKGKAKALPKPAVMKRPSSSSVFACKTAHKWGYNAPPPSDAQLKSTPRNYYDKHYHKCKQMAVKMGYSEEDASEYAKKKARATAVELWDSNCS
eukprot:s6222_g1.t1